MRGLYGHTTDELLDSDAGGFWFAEHMDAMTREGLHSKADIAAELAYRDTKYEAYKAKTDKLTEVLTKLLAHRVFIRWFPKTEAAIEQALAELQDNDTKEKQ